MNCRTNHLHVVVSGDRHPDEIRKQFKAWCTRKLKELERGRKKGGEIKTPARPRWRVGLVSAGTRTRRASEAIPIRENWWAERGSRRYINDEDSLEAAILYVKDAQDRPREH